MKLLPQFQRTRDQTQETLDQASTLQVIQPALQLASNENCDQMKSRVDRKKKQI